MIAESSNYLAKAEQNLVDLQRKLNDLEDAQRMRLDYEFENGFETE